MKADGGGGSGGGIIGDGDDWLMVARVVTVVRISPA
jgi:hypothetical protein